jgi:hypothetical protein
VKRNLPATERNQIFVFINKLSLLLIGAATLSLPAFATPILDFTTGSASGGTISISGSTISGSNIGFGSLNVTGTTTDTGLWTLSSTTAIFSFNTTTNTGTFTLTGTATQGANHTATGVTLLSGNLSGSITSGGAGQTSFALTLVQNGTQLATADNGLEGFLSLASTQTYTISGFFDGVSAGGYPYTANSSELKATAVAATPEPASAFLLGAGFLSLGLLGRRSGRRK